jgi:hypothetical protein
VVQRGPGSTRVKPFIVRVGDIAEGEPVRLAEVEQNIPVWRAKLSGAAARTAERDVATEQIWLVAYYLFRGERTPGIYLHQTELSDTRLAAERVRGALQRRAGSETQTTDGGEHA